MSGFQRYSVVGLRTSKKHITSCYEERNRPGGGTWECSVKRQRAAGAAVTDGRSGDSFGESSEFAELVRCRAPRRRPRERHSSQRSAASGLFIVHACATPSGADHRAAAVKSSPDAPKEAILSGPCISLRVQRILTGPARATLATAAGGECAHRGPPLPTLAQDARTHTAIFGNGPFPDERASPYRSFDLLMRSRGAVSPKMAVSRESAARRRGGLPPRRGWVLCGQKRKPGVRWARALGREKGLGAVIAAHLVVRRLESDTGPRW
ncbi:hypothetical protein MTO96_011573 [Rhipicephalus appendiculatus]